MTHTKPGDDTKGNQDTAAPHATGPTLRTFDRTISPPPIRRKAPGLQLDGDSASPRDHVEQSHEKISPPTKRQRLDNDFVEMYDEERKRLYFLKYSQEMQLSMITDKPGRFSSARGALQSDTLLSSDVAESVRKALREVKADSGSLISVDVPSQRADSKENHGEGYDDTTSAENTSFLASGSNTLCRMCQKLVKESQVLNRPWREITSLQQTGDGKNAFKIQEESNAEYHGRKVDVFGHHGQLGRLKKSAREGCHLCSLLDSFDPRSPFTYDESTRTPYVVKVIYAKNHDEGPGVVVLEAKGCPTKATYLMYEEPPRRVSPTLKNPRTDAPEVLGLAKKWLHTCLDEHETCHARMNGSRSFRPTRLVEIKALGSTIEQLRLVSSLEVPPDTRYLTLSHCWGGADIIKLTKASSKAFRTSIPLVELPRNFFDACHITVALGFSYIWIDSLCIVQDSPHDWKIQADLMGEVYRYSECTIAAVGSKDSHGGCFVNRSALSFTPCQLVPRSKKSPGVYAENWHSQPKPLHTRAWVVQERALSRRTLNFGAEMVEWDCICSKATELVPKMHNTANERGLKRTLHDVLDLSASIYEPSWIAKWWELVQEYSSCNLTFPSDKWPAIQGLAREVQKGRSVALTHGVWSHNFIDDLLWTISTPKPRRFEDAPSWSWLSIDGQVHKRRYNYKQGFKIDVTTLVGGSDVHSELERSMNFGVIGRMIRLDWALREPDADSTPSYPFRLRDGRKAALGAKNLDWDGNWLPDTVPDASWETWALQLVKGGDDETLKTRVGLVVVPVREESSPTYQFYRRVGFYEFIWRESEEECAGEGKRWFGHKNTIYLT